MTDASLLLDAAFQPGPRPVLTLSRVYRQPMETVFAALSTPARLSEWLNVDWLSDPDEPLRVGGPFSYHWRDTDLESRGRVLRLEPPRLIEHSWFENLAEGQTVTWALAPEGEGCRLTLTHRFPAPDDASRTAAGWTFHMASLEGFLDGPAVERPPPDWTGLREGYEARLGPLARRDGTLRREGGLPVVRFKRFLAQPVGKVWAALTLPERLADWLGTVTVEPRVGGAFHILFSQGSTMDGTITALDPQHRLEMIWREAWFTDDTVRLAFELEAVEGGTRLTLTHSFRPDYDPHEYLAGWHEFLDALEPALEGSATDWTAPGRMDRYKVLEHVYAATVPRLEPLP